MDGPVDSRRSGEPADSQRPGAAGSVLNIAYGSDPLQHGELRLPDAGALGAGPRPVVILVHGGGWRAGTDTAYMRPIAEDLRQRGFATWLVEFRRVGDRGGGFPGTLQDVASAADHLQVMAGPHSLDLERVIAMGHSSGGQLALWLGARGGINEEEFAGGRTALRLRGMVSLAGIPNLAAFWRHQEQFHHHNLVAAFLGGSPQQMPDRYAQASPIELLPLGVRQAIVHGEKDLAVPIEMSKAYVEKARTLGDDAWLVEVPGADHFQILDPSGPSWPRVIAALEDLAGI